MAITGLIFQYEVSYAKKHFDSKFPMPYPVFS